MESKEVIEVWRAEFEKYHGSHARFDNGRYVEPMDQTLWVFWVAAKRAQPVVEFESPSLIACDRADDWNDLKHKEIFQDSFVAGAEYVIASLTAAGIQYKVME